MNYVKRYLLFLALIAIVISCSDETIIFENEEESITLESDRSALSGSIQFTNSGVLKIFEPNLSTGKFSKFTDNLAGDYPLTLVATVSPPSFLDGNSLTATDVYIEGDHAYVSYNTVGSTYKGGIDIIDISEPTMPILTDRALVSDKDFNAIHYNKGFIYVVGGIDSEQSALATENSVIMKLGVSNGRFNVSDLAYKYQVGFNATDVMVSGNSLLVTSGRDGSIGEYDKNTFELLSEAPFPDLRSLAVGLDKVAVLDAGVGVRILNSDLSEASQISISSDFRDADKRSLVFTEDKIIVSEGENGAGVYQASTGGLIEHIEIPTRPNNVAESDIVTNSVALNQEILLMANGGAGLSISEEEVSFDPVGIIELEGSINHVVSKGDYAFAASGKKGLQIIKLNRPSESLVAQCEQLPEYDDSVDLYVEGATNLALNKPAVQSSTGWDGPARLAVDGNTSGDYRGDDSVTHTNRDINSWWRVDLGATYEIAMIRVFNRTGVPERLNNTEVYVGDYESVNPLDYTKIGDLDINAIHRFATNISGRYVFIRKTDQNYLSLAEVEVYGRLEGSEQIAFKGSKRLNTLHVNGNLLLCGTWTVVEDVDIDQNALFEMNGSLMVARNSARHNLTIGEGATFRVEGSLTIWGDLILENNATLEFVGDDNNITLYGNIIKNESANIRGSFNDTQNKF